MKPRTPSRSLKCPKLPGFFPFDEHGKAIYDRPTTSADWRKYREDMERFRNQKKEKSKGRKAK